MHTSTLHIVNPGLYSTLQSTARVDMIDKGVSVGGPVDYYNACIANWILGNHHQSTVIETTGHGPSMYFDAACQIAITGAQTIIKIDNQEIPSYQSVTVPANTHLRIHTPEVGFRNYIAIRGKILKKINAIYPSPPFIKNTKIIYKPYINKQPKKVPERLIKEISKSHAIRIVPGPEFHQLSKSQLESFVKKEYTITPTLSRMGIRLSEQVLHWKNETSMISSGVLPGTIQITNDGTPILLLNDAQTTGGYPRIATVIRADMDVLGQLAPGNTITFKIVDLDSAVLADKLYQENISYFYHK